MAGDFVMVQFATPRKPEVLRLANMLGVEPLHAFGLCVAAWMWFDEQTEDGRAFGATEPMLDAVVGRDGFSHALREVGWLQVREGSLVVPNFDRLMGESAKKRGKNSRRQQKLRRASVTDLSRDSRDKSATREEKRREEKNVSPNGDTNTLARDGPASSSRRFTPPTVEEVREYCLARSSIVDAQQFVDYYQANGWVQGRQGKPIKDWKACVRTWENNHNGNGTGVTRTGIGQHTAFQRHQASFDEQIRTIQDWAIRKSRVDGIREVDGLPVRDEADGESDTTAN